MKNDKSSPYALHRKTRELLRSLDMHERPIKENHPLYKMGFEAGVKQAQENHRKLSLALARVYGIVE